MASFGWAATVQGQCPEALSLESAIDKLDKYQELILEDLCYVRKIKLRPRSCSN